MSLRPGILLLLGLALGQLACGSTSVTTVVVVRHAEKESGDDPVLTAAGTARAQALVAAAEAALGGKPTAIYHTPYNRTRLTAEPSAAAAGVDPIVFPVNGSAEQHAQELAAAIIADQVGERVLVVGHSNTVPLILAALGAENPPEIGHHEYDGFYKIVLREGGTPAFLTSTY